VQVPLPSQDLLRDIVRQIAGLELPDGLLATLFRIADAVRKDNPELAPSPKELAYCACDLMTLAKEGIQDQLLWQEAAASWLVKEGGIPYINTLLKYRWAQALRTEAQR